MRLLLRPSTRAYRGLLDFAFGSPCLVDCGSVRAVVCSGEALSYDLKERFFSTLDAELHNLNGPTEAAVDVTHWKCEPGGEDRVVPIGANREAVGATSARRRTQAVDLGVEQGDQLPLAGREDLKGD